MATKKKQAGPPAGLAEAVKDLKSDAYRGLLASAPPTDVDALLAGVAWEKGKYATSFGALRGNALFTGRGPSARPMAARLLAFVGEAPGKVAAAIRASVESLGIDGKAGAPLDVSALGHYPALARVQLRDASRIEGASGLRHVAELTLWRIGTLDLSALEGPDDARLTAFDCAEVRGLDAPGRPDLSLWPAPAGTDLSNVRARSLGVGSARGVTSMGPIGGTLTTLRVRGGHDGNALARVELGALPAIEELELKAHQTLRDVVGLAPLDRLRTLELHGLFTSIPSLSPTLRVLKTSGPLTDASALAGTPGLTELELRVNEPVRALPGLEAIAAMREMEALVVAGHVPLRFLDALPVLPRLRSIGLEYMELERIPELARFGPEIETVSVFGSRAFMEHDTLRQLPKLKHLWIAGSTLARHRSQIDPRIAKAGVEIHD